MRIIINMNMLPHMKMWSKISRNISRNTMEIVNSMKAITLIPV